MPRPSLLVFLRRSKSNRVGSYAIVIVRLWEVAQQSAQQSASGSGSGADKSYTRRESNRIESNVEFTRGTLCMRIITRHSSSHTRGGTRVRRGATSRCAAPRRSESELRLRPVLVVLVFQRDSMSEHNRTAGTTCLIIISYNLYTLCKYKLTYSLIRFIIHYSMHNSCSKQSRFTEFIAFASS